MDWYNVLLFISLLLVVLVLAWGLITMARGGEYNKSKSNLLMRYRIVFQALKTSMAPLLYALFIYISSIIIWIIIDYFLTTKLNE